jgi:DNA polymerase (family 10)
MMKSRHGGTELNVAPDGSVDWDDDFLSGFDMCVASVQMENPIPKTMHLTTAPQKLESRGMGTLGVNAPSSLPGRQPGSGQSGCP